MNLFKRNNEEKKELPVPGKMVGRIVISITQEGNNRNINVNIEGNLPLDTAYVALDVAKDSIIKGRPVLMGNAPKEDLSYVG